MLIDLKKNLNKIKFLKKIPGTAARYSFLSCLIFFFFALVLGGILFYKYVILAQKTAVETIQKSSLLQENIYQEILKNWQEQERRFNEADFKEYQNPFKKYIKPTPTPSPTPTSIPAS